MGSGCHSPDHMSSYVGKNVEIAAGVDFNWMQTDSDRLKTYLENEHHLTEADLQSIAYNSALRKSIDDRVKEAPIYSSLQPTEAGVYFLHRGPQHESTRLHFLEKGHKEPREVELEPLKDPNSKLKILNYFASNTGRYVLVSLSSDGTEKSTLVIYDRKVRSILAESFKVNVHARASFLPDDSGFVYNLGEPGSQSDSPKRNSLTRFHKIGTDPSTDPIIFSGDEAVNGSKQTNDVMRVLILPASQVAVGVATEGISSRYRLYFKSIKDLQNSDKSWVKIFDESAGYLDFCVNDASIFWSRDKGDGNLDIFRVSFENLKPKESLVFTNPDWTVLSFGATSKNLLVLTRRDLNTKLVVQELKTGKNRSLTDEAGYQTTAIVTSPTENLVYLKKESYSFPAQYFAYRLDNRELVLMDQFQSKSNDAQIIATTYFAASSDSTEVPYIIIRDKRTQLSVNTPTMLESYASYGTLTTPFYDRTSVDWFKRGGVIVKCLARGGGDLGIKWHEGAKRVKKINSYLDTIACADDLIRRGFTSSRKLAYSTNSAGGLIASSILNFRPELFRAIVCNACILNVTEILKTKIGEVHISEFGDPRDPSEGGVLQKMDAYLGAKTSKELPAILIAHGFEDSRVPVWMSAKVHAKIKSLNPERKDILLRIDFGGGHGPDALRTQRTYLWADFYSFLMRELDVN